MKNGRVRANNYSPQHNRRSIRLKGYDYSQAGAYFVTICTQNKECLFGEIVDGNMVLNDAGRIVTSEWRNTPILRPYIEMVGARRAVPLRVQPKNLVNR